LRGWITHHQPDIVLTGHVHESPFKPTGSWADRIGRTWVFNAGRQIGQVPAHVVIDLVAGRAVWHSLMGEETLDLADAQAPQRSVF
jgi:Icc-related predicted phosphoesterase